MSLPRSSRRGSIVLAGALTQKPGRGGHTWVFLQYLLGFKKLGWDVLFLDYLDRHLAIDATGSAAPLAASWNVRYLDEVMQGVGLAGDYALICDGGVTFGLGRDKVLERVRRSAALINVMGFLNDAEILSAAERRVFLDIDPGFPQMWHALHLHDAFQGHDQFVTIGENIGRPGCMVPTCGRTWITTRPPVVLEHWPEVEVSPTRRRPVTTVASWRGAYGPIEYDGKTYGLRAREFRKFAALPTLTNRPFEIALDIHAADQSDRALLMGHGWSVVDPREVAADPWRYREFIQGSAAEIMIAKGMYVQARSGWFSDRSACYLASARPVIAQDTGLGDLLPTTSGLVTFSTLEGAVDATRAVDGDYARHARAARRLAEERFDSSLVLDELTRRLDL